MWPFSFYHTMFPSTQLSTLFIILVLVIGILQFSSAKRGYDLELTDIKCTFNANFVSNVSCFFNPKTHEHNMEFMAKKDFKKFAFDFIVSYRRSGSKRKNTLFQATDIAACDLMSKERQPVVLEMFHKVLQDPKNEVPDLCAVKAGFRLKLTNIYLDPEELPSYSPEVPFVVNIKAKEMGTMIVNAELSGKIVHIKKGKPKQ